MMPYEYSMEHVPVDMSKGPAQAGEELATRLQSLANEKSRGGWELHRTDTFDVTVPSGCLGVNREEREYVVATFHREQRSSSSSN